MKCLLPYAVLCVSALAAVPVALKLGGAAWPPFWLLLLLHLVSAFLCAAALHVVTRSLGGKERKGFLWFVFVLIVCLAMPAYGCFASIAIYALQRMRGRRPPLTVSDEISVQSEDVFRNGKLRTSSLEILERLDIEPFVDIFRSGGPELKRSAVKFLSAIKTQAAVKALNKALVSEEVEVRLYAAGVIGLIDDNFTKEVDARKTEYESHPDDEKRAFFLAQIYMSYAESGLLDAIARVYYYREAIAVLERMPEKQETRFMLARAHHALGENERARELVESCLRVEASNPAYNRLFCSILFSRHEYGELMNAVRRMLEAEVIRPNDELVKVWL